MRVRIQNDGKPGYATTITNAETGEDLTRILRVDEIHITVGGLPHAILHCALPSFDIIAEAEIREEPKE